MPNYIIYNSDKNRIEHFDGVKWQEVKTQEDLDAAIADIPPQPPQPPTPPPPVAGFLGGNAVYVTDDTNVAGGYDLDANTAEITWESYGPTASGATNLVAGLDVIPSTAKAVVLRVETFVSTTSTLTGLCSLYARVSGSTNPVSVLNRKVRFGHISPATAQHTTVGSQEIIVEVDSNIMFDLYWSTGAGVTVGGSDLDLDIYVAGWIAEL